MSSQVIAKRTFWKSCPIPLLFPTNANRCIGCATIILYATGTCTNGNSSIVSYQRGTPAMTFGGTGSGKPPGRPRGSRNALSEAVICAFLRDFPSTARRPSPKVRATQPAAYLKICRVAGSSRAQSRADQRLSGPEHRADENISRTFRIVSTAARLADQAKLIEGRDGRDYGGSDYHAPACLSLPSAGRTG